MTTQTPNRHAWFHSSHEDITNETDQLTFNELPPFYPRFFVPALQEKPQNPIMENIRLFEKNKETRKDSPKMWTPLPPELNIITEDMLQLRQQSRQSEESLNWSTVSLQKNRRKLLSWDALRPVNQPACSPTPFLSEQDSLVYASARHQVNPRLKDASTSIVYVNQSDLFSSLKMTVLGNSSLYHTWDAKSERFVQRGVREGGRGFLLLDGEDEVITNSVIARFLTIGNLMRRLDILLASLRSRSANKGPTIHAFTHALSETLKYLRGALAKCPPSPEVQAGRVPIFSVWMQYRIYEDILTALAELCRRTEDQLPDQYEALETNPISLLSRIYHHLDLHIIRQSSPTITAILAYVLTCTSQEYLRQIAQSVGLGHPPPRKRERITNLALDEYTLDEDAEDEEDIFDVLERVEDDYPSFFPPDLLSILPAAQRSLILLKRAQSDHPLLSQSAQQTSVRWLWRKEDVEAAWSGSRAVNHIHSTTVGESKTIPETHPTFNYKSELAGFQVFDMEPGSHTEKSLGTDAIKEHTVQNFIDSFPDTLPSITPTLVHLSSVVFSDLLQHASGLSSALLNLLLDHPGELNIRSHLILLRDFLLLMSSPFKSRLSAALFSDKEDYEIDIESRTDSLQLLRQRKRIAKSTQPWAVGLVSALLEREIWPPVGADLSFFLRTVIVDSLEYPQGGYQLPKQVVNDASWRLGFAIRDLPLGRGRDKWLNPLCIEALDFLYMDYKPPHPLEVIISPEVLSKYQRMFTFLLRLVRVEHALRAIHRMTRPTAIPIFPTLVAARKLTLHFRFVAQSFVNALSGYVFDTVIGGNVNPFITQLVPTHGPKDAHENTKFSDIFELAKRHSDLLDDILSACLMRSGQRAAGDLLRQATETTLEFAVVIGELHRERLQEYEAAPMVERLFAKFRTEMSTLTTVLKGLSEKSSSKSFEEQLLTAQRNLSGGTQSLYHLLLRIDISDWWSTIPQ